MKIINSTINDLESIQILYNKAITYQKSKKGLPWPIIDKDLIEQEILENRQWKLTIDADIACIWMTTFNDPDIWLEKNEAPSMYIHRIAMNPKFRGKNLLSNVFDWAKSFAVQNQKKLLRLDIASINPGLITLYVKNGFKFIDIHEIGISENLPSHYHNASVCLLEMKI